MLMPIIEIGAQLSAQIDFTYGFDLTVRFGPIVPLFPSHRVV